MGIDEFVEVEAGDESEEGSAEVSTAEIDEQESAAPVEAKVPAEVEAGDESEEASAEVSTVEIDEQESAAPVEAKAPSEDETSEPDESSENSSATDAES